MKLPPLIAQKQGLNLDETIVKKDTSMVVLISTIVIAATVLTILTAIVSAQLAMEQSNNQQETVQEYPIFWDINKSQPSDTSNQFDLTLTSNAGNIRTYTNLISYGLSKNGQYLAANSANGLEIIDLNEDNKIKVVTHSFGGDYGNSIGWTYDSEHFALSIINNLDPKDTAILIFDKEGTLTKELAVNIPTKITDKVIVEPVQTSPRENLILIRTYKAEDQEFVKADGSDYSVSELPIYLTILRPTGEVLEEYNVRDYDEGTTEIEYQWDFRRAGVVKYVLYNVNALPDFSNDFIFTKLKIY